MDNDTILIFIFDSIYLSLLRFFLKNDEKPCNGMKLEVIPDQIEDEAE